MEDNFSEFLKIIEEMEKEGVSYFIIGGFALVLHGIPRFTEDIDIVIKNDEDNINKLRKVLFRIYNDDELKEITFAEIEKYPVIRYGSPTGVYIDIMTKLGGKVLFDELEFREFEIEGKRIKIATLKSLYETKKNSLREKDKMDVTYILERMKGEEDAGI